MWTCDLEMGAAQLVHELLVALLEQLCKQGDSLDTWAGDIELCFAFKQDSCDNPTILVTVTFVSAPGLLELAGGRLLLRIKGRVFAPDLAKFSVVVGQRFATQLLTLSRRKVTNGQAVPTSQADMKGIVIKCNLPA